MWEHALCIRLCQCLPVGVCHLPLCLVSLPNLSGILSLKTKDTIASCWLFDFVSYFLARYKNENYIYIHGYVHLESNLVIVQKDATVLFIIFL